MTARVLCCLLLAACGRTGTTSTALLGGGQAGLATASLGDVTSRAIQVGATSARAERCGFYFDAARLRQQYLAAEAALGSPPEDLQKAERAYDFARANVAQSAAKDANYCSDERTLLIKADLNRHLAGDFTPRPRKAEAQGLLTLDDLTTNSDTSFNPNTFFDMTGKPGKSN